MTTTLAVLCLAIVVVSLLGGMLPLAKTLDHTRLQVYLSLSAGVMLGAAFFHMLPEAVRLGSSGTIHWTAVGLVGLFLVERFFSYHHHESPEHGHGSRQSVLVEGDSGGNQLGRVLGHHSMGWGAAAFGLGFHSLVGGVALASAVAADRAFGKGLGSASLGVFLATLAHKPADALTITSLLVQAGASRPAGHLVNLAFALMIPLGAGLFALGLGDVGIETRKTETAAALAFSAGTFLCVALSDILPELHFHAHDRIKLSAALLCGLLLMAGVAALGS
jgi:zinc and cadmium transporter